MANLFIILSFCLYLTGFSQTKAIYPDSTKKQLNLIVKTDVLFPAINLIKYHHAEFSFTVEKLFSKRHSFQLTLASFGNYKWTETYIDNQTLVTGKNQNNSIAIVPEYKFFVSKKKNYTGYYIGASAAYLLQSDHVSWSQFIPAGVTYNHTTGPTTLSSHGQENGNGLAVGIINGVQYYVAKHLVLDFIAGGGIAWFIDNQGFNSSQFIWRLALNVGYRF